MDSISFAWMRRCTEIPVLLLFYGFMVSGSVGTNFIIYRTCYVTLNYSESDCAKLGSKHADNYTQELEKIVQPYANVIGMTQSLATQILPAIMCLFIGPWSDKHGRKPVMITSLAGYTIGTIVTIVVILIPNLSPWYILLECIPSVLGGGFTPYLTIALCYISDISTPENRGMRLGIFEGVLGFGMILGSLSSSYIFALGGYVTVFGIAAACYFLACLYSAFVISETVAYNADQDNSSIFSGRNVKDMLYATFRPRESYTRSVLLLTVGMAVIFIMASNSDTSVFFLFLREKFKWSLEKYTIFSSIRGLLWILGTFIVLFVFNKLLKITEAPLLLTGFLVYFASVLLQGFASLDWHIYLAATIRSISGVVSPMCRSLISKLVSADETGKVFSLTVTLESLMVVVGAPLYTLIYNSTLDTSPGVFNFVTAGLFGILIIFVIVVLIIQKKVQYSNVYKALPINVEE